MLAKLFYLMIGLQALPLLGFSQKGKPATGQQLYETHCAACHQPDGEGVPRLNPALVGSKALLAKNRLPIRIVLQGSKAQYEREESHANQMPAQAFLTDAQIASILSYARKSWGNKAASISKQQVAAERKKLKK